MDHPAGRAAVELAAGELDLATGRPDVAARRLVRVVEACDGRPVEAARARLALATAEARCGRPVAAACTLETAIADASAHGIRPLLADLLHARGLLRRDRGDVAAAREDFRAAIGEIEAIRGSLQAERFRAA